MEPIVWNEQTGRVVGEHQRVAVYMLSEAYVDGQAVSETSDDTEDG